MIAKGYGPVPRRTVMGCTGGRSAGSVTGRGAELTNDRHGGRPGDVGRPRPETHLLPLGMDRSAAGRGATVRASARLHGGAGEWRSTSVTRSSPYFSSVAHGAAAARLPLSVTAKLKEKSAAGRSATHCSHSVTKVGLAWMHTRFAGPGPWLVNLCGTFGGTITMSPGPASSRSWPASKVRCPSMTTQVSS